MTRRRHIGLHRGKPHSSWPIVLLILLGIGLIGTLDVWTKETVKEEWVGK